MWRHLLAMGALMAAGGGVGSETMASSDMLRVQGSEPPPSMQLPWQGRGKPKSRHGHTPGTSKRRRWKAWRRGGRKGALR